MTVEFVLTHCGIEIEYACLVMVLRNGKEFSSGDNLRHYQNFMTVKFIYIYTFKNNLKRNPCSSQ